MLQLVDRWHEFDLDFFFFYNYFYLLWGEVMGEQIWKDWEEYDGVHDVKVPKDQ